MALTDVMIRRAKPKEKAYRISDGGSMFLRVTPAGGKLWRWAYLYEGKEKLMSFGRYPDVSLAMARERHSGARRSLVAGVDPTAQRKAEKTAEQVASENSFASVATRWIQQSASPSLPVCMSMQKLEIVRDYSTFIRLLIFCLQGRHAGDTFLLVRFNCPRLGR